MKKIKKKDQLLKPLYCSWGEDFKEYYHNYKNIYILLSPFVKVPKTYNPKSKEQNIWWDTLDTFYPTDEFSLNECDEIKWSYILKESSLKSIGEINHALISNALSQKHQNNNIQDILYTFCHKHSIYYPPDGDFSPFILEKIVNLARKICLKKICIISEFQNEIIEFNKNEVKLILKFSLQTPSISIDDHTLFINHWDSYITLMISNLELNINNLKDLGFEVLAQHEFPKFDFW